jgi:mitotic spindle assembly checkpoint protein MAD1
MSERPLKKKRSLDVVENDNVFALTLGGAAASSLSFTSSHPVTSHLTIVHQEQVIANLRSELHHEQAARALETKTFTQRIARLEQQVAWASDEAASARSLLSESTTESERHIAQLTKARDQALSLNRQLQLQLEQAQQDLELAEAAQNEAEQYQTKCAQLQAQVRAQSENEAKFQQQIQQLRESVEEKLEAAAELASRTAADHEQRRLPLLEEAPSAVLCELNRHRILLAEKERECRQLQNKLENAVTKCRQVVRDGEKASLEAARYPGVVQELQRLTATYEQEHAQLTAWHDVAQQLQDTWNQEKALSGSSSPSSSSSLPAPATVLRWGQKLQVDLQAAWQSVAKYQSERDALRTELIVGSGDGGGIAGSLEKQLEKSAWAAQEREWQVKLDRSTMQLQTAQLEATLFQREADSLRQLIQTFEEQIERGEGEVKVLDISTPPLQLRLDTLTEQLRVLQDSHTALTQQLEASQAETLQATAELDRVRTKFAQLREALSVEKDKVAAYEARVIQAEQLAGKGSFDPQRTRVLHLTETPLVQSLKEQIQGLQAQLAESASNTPEHMATHKAAGDGAVALANPDKLNQRLKETFKEQIAIFREAVYLMTGFKVDMLTTMDRPTFRLRSVFAEQEEDQLLLQWPKHKVKDDATSLDILQTELGQLLATTPSYEYMTKFHSLPAFLASVQLSLFEKQTVMM